jgi:hypothetical protein
MPPRALIFACPSPWSLIYRHGSHTFSYFRNRLCRLAADDVIELHSTRIEPESAVLYHIEPPPLRTLDLVASAALLPAAATPSPGAAATRTSTVESPASAAQTDATTLMEKIPTLSSCSKRRRWRGLMPRALILAVELLQLLLFNFKPG